jgi:phosphoglycolate phosphatase
MSQVNNNKFKLAVFDWNGTLFDDEKAVIAGDNAQREVFGLATVSIDTFRQQYQIPINKFYEEIGVSSEDFSQNSEAAAKAFHEVYEPIANTCDLRPGALNLLNYLKEQNIACIILSNHTYDRINFQLKRLCISGYFETILANEDMHSNHFIGKGGRLKSYLEETGQDPSQAFIVGDTKEETEIGKELGLMSLSITGGYSSEDRLRAAKPNVLIHNLADIVDKIKEL